MRRTMDPFQKSNNFVLEEEKKKDRGRKRGGDRRERGRQEGMNETVTLGILPLNKN